MEAVSSGLGRFVFGLKAAGGLQGSDDGSDDDDDEPRRSKDKEKPKVTRSSVVIDAGMTS